MLEQASQLKSISKFKQYYCQTFADLLTGQYSPLTKSQISFPVTNPNKQLPKFYRDSTTDKIYLLKWSENTTKYSQKFLLQLLDLSAIQQVSNKDQGKRSKNFIHDKPFPIHQITFNNQPEQIAIVSDYFFAIGGQAVQIVSISLQKDNFETVKERISYENIQAVCGFLSENKNPSIYVYTKDSKNKLSCLTISLYSDNSRWLNKIKNYFTYKPKRIDNYSEMRVVVPGVLGIVFFNNKKSLSLINLANFQFIANTYYELSGWQIDNISNVKIRYKKGDGKSHIYEDSLTLCIAQSNFMELLHISLRLRQDKNIPEQVLKIFHIKDYPYEQLIDWQNCNLTGIITYCHGQQILEDIQFVKDGIVVCGRKNNLCKFPRYSFYAAPYYSLNTQRNVIISHQWSLWSDYLKHLSKKNTPIKPDQLLICNKYPLDFILWSNDQHYTPENKIQMLNVLDFQKINNKKLLFDWLKQFRVLKLISYKGQLLILRKHCISVLLPITDLQYKAENYQLQKTSLELAMKRQLVYSSDNNGREQLEMIGQQFADRESQFASDVMSHLQIDYSDASQDRIISSPTLSLSNQQKLEIYSQICEDIYNCINDSFNNNSLSLTIPSPKYAKQFIYKKSLVSILSNRVKDVIFLYSKIITADLLTLQNAAKPEYPMRPFISLLQFYATIIKTDLQKQYQTSGGDIIDKFISNLQKKQLLTGDLQIDICCCLGRLFQHLIPFKILSLEYPEEQNQIFLTKVMQNIQNQACVCSQLPTFNQKQQRIVGQNLFLDFLFQNYISGYKKCVTHVISKYVWILQKYGYEPVNFSILRIHYINCISDNSQQNQNKLKKYMTTYLINASQHSKRTENSLVYQSQIIDNIMNLLCTELANSAQIRSKVEELLITSFPNLLCSYYFQIQNQRPLLKSIGKDILLKKMLLEYFRENLSAIWNERRKKQDIRQVFKIKLDELDSKVQNKIEKLKLISDEEQLLQYLAVVFEARCQLFNYRFGFKDREQLLKLLQKCQKSYIQLFDEYKSIYGWQLECQSQNIEDVDEQKKFIDCVYPRQRASLLGKMPTTPWIKIIQEVLKDDNFQLNDIMDRQEKSIFDYNLNTIEMNSPQTKIGYYYLWKIITGKEKNVTALDELIQVFGRSVLNQWICVHIKFLQAYAENTSNQFKARLKYVHVNRQLRERFREAAKYMSYRNAVIETMIDQAK